MHIYAINSNCGISFRDHYWAKSVPMIKKGAVLEKRAKTSPKKVKSKIENDQNIKSKK